MITDKVIDYTPVNKGKSIIMIVIMAVLAAVSITFGILFAVKPTVKPYQVNGIQVENNLVKEASEPDTFIATSNGLYTITAMVSAPAEADTSVEFEFLPDYPIKDKRIEKIEGTANTKITFRIDPNSDISGKDISLNIRSVSTAKVVQTMKIKVKETFAESLEFVNPPPLIIPFFETLHLNETYTLNVKQLGKLISENVYEQISRNYKSNVDEKYYIDSLKFEIKDFNAATCPITMSQSSVNLNQYVDFTAARPGSATIVVTANNYNDGENITKEFNITVKNNVDMGKLVGFYLMPEGYVPPVSGPDYKKAVDSLTIYAGDSTPYLLHNRIFVKPYSMQNLWAGMKVTVTSDNPDIANITKKSSTGEYQVVSNNKQGTCTITIKDNTPDGFGAELKIRVRAVAQIKNIDLRANSTDINSMGTSVVQVYSDTEMTLNLSYKIAALLAPSKEYVNGAFTYKATVNGVESNIISFKDYSAKEGLVSPVLIESKPTPSTTAISAVTIVRIGDILTNTKIKLEIISVEASVAPIVFTLDVRLAASSFEFKIGDDSPITFENDNYYIELNKGEISSEISRYIVYDKEGAVEAIKYTVDGNSINVSDTGVITALNEGAGKVIVYFTSSVTGKKFERTLYVRIVDPIQSLVITTNNTPSQLEKNYKLNERLSLDVQKINARKVSEHAIADDKLTNVIGSAELKVNLRQVGSITHWEKRAKSGAINTLEVLINGKVYFEINGASIIIVGDLHKEKIYGFEVVYSLEEWTAVPPIISVNTTYKITRLLDELRVYENGTYQENTPSSDQLPKNDKGEFLLTVNQGKGFNLGITKVINSLNILADSSGLIEDFEVSCGVSANNKPIATIEKVGDKYNYNNLTAMQLASGEYEAKGIITATSKTSKKSIKIELTVVNKLNAISEINVYTDNTYSTKLDTSVNPLILDTNPLSSKNRKVIYYEVIYKDINSSLAYDSIIYNNADNTSSIKGDDISIGSNEISGTTATKRMSVELSANNLNKRSDFKISASTDSVNRNTVVNVRTVTYAETYTVKNSDYNFISTTDNVITLEIYGDASKSKALLNSFFTSQTVGGSVDMSNISYSVVTSDNIKCAHTFDATSGFSFDITHLNKRVNAGEGTIKITFTDRINNISKIIDIKVIVKVNVNSVHLNKPIYELTTLGTDTLLTETATVTFNNNIAGVLDPNERSVTYYLSDAAAGPITSPIITVSNIGEISVSNKVYTFGANRYYITAKSANGKTSTSEITLKTDANYIKFDNFTRGQEKYSTINPNNIVKFSAKIYNEGDNANIVGAVNYSLTDTNNALLSNDIATIDANGNLIIKVKSAKFKVKAQANNAAAAEIEVNILNAVASITAVGFDNQNVEAGKNTSWMVMGSTHKVSDNDVTITGVTSWLPPFSMDFTVKSLNTSVVTIDTDGKTLIAKSTGFAVIVLTSATAEGVTPVTYEITVTVKKPTLNAVWTGDNTIDVVNTPNKELDVTVNTDFGALSDVVLTPTGANAELIKIVDGKVVLNINDVNKVLGTVTVRVSGKVNGIDLSSKDLSMTVTASANIMGGLYKIEGSDENPVTGGEKLNSGLIDSYKLKADLSSVPVNNVGKSLVKYKHISGNFTINETSGVISSNGVGIFKMQIQVLCYGKTFTFDYEIQAENSADLSISIKQGNSTITDLAIDFDSAPKTFDVVVDYSGVKADIISSDISMMVFGAIDGVSANGEPINNSVNKTYTQSYKALKAGNVSFSAILVLDGKSYQTSKATLNMTSVAPSFSFDIVKKIINPGEKTVINSNVDVNFMGAYTIEYTIFNSPNNLGSLTNASIGNSSNLVTEYNANFATAGGAVTIRATFTVTSGAYKGLVAVIDKDLTVNSYEKPVLKVSDVYNIDAGDSVNIDSRISIEKDPNDIISLDTKRYVIKEGNELGQLSDASFNVNGDVAAGGKVIISYTAKVSGGYYKGIDLNAELTITIKPKTSTTSNITELLPGAESAKLATLSALEDFETISNTVYSIVSLGGGDLVDLSNNEVTAKWFTSGGDVTIQAATTIISGDYKGTVLISSCVIKVHSLTVNYGTNVAPGGTVTFTNIKASGESDYIGSGATVTMTASNNTICQINNNNKTVKINTGVNFTGANIPLEIIMEVVDNGKTYRNKFIIEITSQEVPDVTNVDITVDDALVTNGQVRQGDSVIFTPNVNNTYPITSTRITVDRADAGAIVNMNTSSVFNVSSTASGSVTITLYVTVYGKEYKADEIILTINERSSSDISVTSPLGIVFAGNVINSTATVNISKWAVGYQVNFSTAMYSSIKITSNGKTATSGAGSVTINFDNLTNNQANNTLFIEATTKANATGDANLTVKFSYKNNGNSWSTTYSYSNTVAVKLSNVTLNNNSVEASAASSAIRTGGSTSVTSNLNTSSASVYTISSKTYSVITGGAFVDVSAMGLVTAKGVIDGTATVRCTINAGGASYYKDVVINVVANRLINVNGLNGDTNVLISDKSTTAVLSLSNETGITNIVYSVSGAGTITGKTYNASSYGIAEITATYQVSGVSFSEKIKFTVAAKPSLSASGTGSIAPNGTNNITLSSAQTGNVTSSIVSGNSLGTLSNGTTKNPTFKAAADTKGGNVTILFSLEITEGIYKGVTISTSYTFTVQSSAMPTLSYENNSTAPTFTNGSTATFTAKVSEGFQYVKSLSIDGNGNIIIVFNPGENKVIGGVEIYVEATLSNGAYIGSVINATAALDVPSVNKPTLEYNNTTIATLSNGTAAYTAKVVDGKQFVKSMTIDSATGKITIEYYPHESGLVGGVTIDIEATLTSGDYAGSVLKASTTLDVPQVIKPTLSYANNSKAPTFTNGSTATFTARVSKGFQFVKSLSIDENGNITIEFNPSKTEVLGGVEIYVEATLTNGAYAGDIINAMATFDILLEDMPTLSYSGVTATLTSGVTAKFTARTTVGAQYVKSLSMDATGNIIIVFMPNESELVDGVTIYVEAIITNGAYVGSVINAVVSLDVPQVLKPTLSYADNSTTPTLTDGATATFTVNITSGFQYVRTVSINAATGEIEIEYIPNENGVSKGVTVEVEATLTNGAYLGSILKASATLDVPQVLKPTLEYNNTTTATLSGGATATFTAVISKGYQYVKSMTIDENSGVITIVYLPNESGVSGGVIIDVTATLTSGDYKDSVLKTGTTLDVPQVKMPTLTYSGSNPFNPNLSDAVTATYSVSILSGYKYVEDVRVDINGIVTIIFRESASTILGAVVLQVNAVVTETETGNYVGLVISATITADAPKTILPLLSISADSGKTKVTPTLIGDFSVTYVYTVNKTGVAVTPDGAITADANILGVYTITCTMEITADNENVGGALVGNSYQASTTIEFLPTITYGEEITDGGDLSSLIAISNGLTFTVKTEFVSVVSDFDLNNNLITYNAGTMTADEAVSIRFTVTVTSEGEYKDREFVVEKEILVKFI